MFAATSRALLPISVLAALVCAPAFIASQAPDPDRLVTFRIIVASTDEAARRIAQQIAAGGNIVALAGAESIDPSASSGGLIGPIALSALRPEVRDALQGLAPGQLSAIIRVPLGFAIVQLVPPASS